MLATRVAAKPKLALSINTSVSQQARPTLSLKSPASFRAPVSPLCQSPAPLSPTVRNTRFNQYSTSASLMASQAPQATYAYTNSSTARSILKKSASASAAKRSLSWDDKPVVYCVTPIEEPDYYGESKKMSRDERRWSRRA